MMYGKYMLVCTVLYNIIHTLQCDMCVYTTILYINCCVFACADSVVSMVCCGTVHVHVNVCEALIIFLYIPVTCIL